MTHLGVDVSGGSKDQTVIARRHDLWFDQMIVKEGVDCKDGPAVAGQIMAAMRDGAIINIDTTGGWGNSAYDHLKNQVKQISLNGIVFSGKSSATSRDGKMRFANKRVEMYWRFREALDPSYGVPISLPDDNRLKADLAAARWEPRPGGYIAIEDKDEIRRRLGRSPDRGDAVVIAWNCNKSVSYAGRSEASNGYSVSDGSSRTPGLATRTANLGYSTFKSSRHRRR